MKNNQLIKEYKLKPYIKQYYWWYVFGGMAILAAIWQMAWQNGFAPLLFVAASIYLILAIILVYHAWRYAQYTQNQKEFLLLKSNGFTYNIYPHGSGSLKYEWLKVIDIVQGNTGAISRIHFKYRKPEMGAGLEYVDLDFSRIIMPLEGSEDVRIQVAEQIRAQCLARGHQLTFLCGKNILIKK